MCRVWQVGAIFAANWKDSAAPAARAATLEAKLRQFFPALSLTEAALQGTRAQAEAAAVGAAEAALVAQEAKLEGAKAGLSLEAARYVSLLQASIATYYVLRTTYYVLRQLLTNYYVVLTTSACCR